MALSDIPVCVEEGPLSGHGLAILTEVETLLDALLRTSEGGSVDIRGLPLTPADRQWLKAQLGEGEVTIDMAIGGASRIQETGLPAVWWIEHRDDAGRLISEFIEVAYVPELISAHPDDVESGLEHLRSRIADLS